MKREKNILGAVSPVLLITILSKLLSLFSVQFYMAHYGVANEYLNIYSYVISIPNIVFTCIGTALSTVVIPIYVGHRAKGQLTEAKRFADNIITVSLALTFVLMLIGFAISPILPKYTAFAEKKELYSFTVKALMIVFPVMFFYALNYIFQGMLQSMGRYKLPAFVTVPSSLVVIVYTLFLGDTFGISGLLVATVIGLSLQALILVPPLIREGYYYKPSFQIKHPDIIKAGKMAIPVQLGVGAYQLNMLYNVTMIARFEGMVTLLTYVQNLTLQMVLALVFAVTAVIYPKLTESASKGNMDEYKATLLRVLMSMSALLIPMTFGFIGVRNSLLTLLAGWGQITPGDINKAAMLLAVYAIGILGVGYKEILDRALYSLGNTVISAVNGLVIMVANISISLILIQFLGAYGIPLAYSCASLIGMCVLLFVVRKKIGTFAKGLGVLIVKSIIASLIMFLVVELLNALLPDAGTVVSRIISLLVPVGAGALVYVIMAVVLKITPVTELLFKFLKRGEK